MNMGAARNFWCCRGRSGTNNNRFLNGFIKAIIITTAGPVSKIDK
jgi:hypothetical protein